MMNNSSYTKRDNCRLCSSKSITSVLRLEDTPPANNFVKASDLTKEQEKFPLELFFCQDCSHLQLPYVVNPNFLFDDYVYVSGTSPVFIKHFSDYADSLITNYAPSKNNIIVDIGSNDGTFLKFFKEKGYEVLGIDPAVEISEKANEKGIKTINSFFDHKLAKQLKLNYPKASIISANNVFAHADDLVGILDGVKQILSNEGIFVFEVSYLVDVFEKNLFDTIYHEHLSYHSVKPLKKFFKNNDMQLIDVQRIPTHGGSIRGIAQFKDGPRKERSTVEKIILMEEEKQVDKISTFMDFAENINKLKEELTNTLLNLRKKNKKIAGFGAPAKATTLMYQFDLNKDIIDFIVDDNPLKQNTFTPGLHVPVLSSDALEYQKPDYLLILAWNFADSIIEKNKDYLNSGGHFIIPLPEIKII